MMLKVTNRSLSKNQKVKCRRRINEAAGRASEIEQLAKATANGLESNIISNIRRKRIKCC